MVKIGSNKWRKSGILVGSGERYHNWCLNLRSSTVAWRYLTLMTCSKTASSCFLCFLGTLGGIICMWAQICRYTEWYKYSNDIICTHQLGRFLSTIRPALGFVANCIALFLCHHLHRTAFRCKSRSHSGHVKPIPKRKFCVWLGKGTCLLLH